MFSKCTQIARRGWLRGLPVLLLVPALSCGGSSRTVAPACGDDTVQAELGETCDPPGDPAGVNGNLCRPNCTVCGDGVRNPGEDCDDGNSVPADGCENDCTMFCGDGFVAQGSNETCDPPGDPAGANGNLCRADCTVCGDGVRDPGEDCDDGNSVPADGCENDCTMFCGDGFVAQGSNETCDPPGSAAGASGNSCRGDCTVCGDAVLDPGEDCDDGNNVPADGCENDCTRFCGDGFVAPGSNETCDPPGSAAGASGNPCRGDCTVCGDGVTDATEACDDANTLDDSDDCTNLCALRCLEFEGESAPVPSTVVVRQVSSACDTVTVELLVSDVDDVFSANFNVIFDPQVATFEDWSITGSILTSDGATVIPLVLPQSGQVLVSLSRVSPASGINVVGTQLLMRMTFGRGTGFDDSLLTFFNASLKDSSDPPVTIPDVDWIGGTLRIP